MSAVVRLLPFALVLHACGTGPAPDAADRTAQLEAVDADLRAGRLRLRAGSLVLRVAGATGLSTLLGAAPEIRRGDEVDVRADRVTIDSRRREARFEGRVRLRRGEAELSCRLLLAEIGEGTELLHARAEGDVRVRVAGVMAIAPLAEIDLERGVARLSGGVTVERRDARISGETVALDLDGGQIVIERARGVFRLGRSE